MITCAELEDWVANYLEGSLSLPKRRELERQLGECRGCREFLAAYRRTVWVAKKALEMLELPSASAGTARSSDPRVAPAMTFLSLTINGSTWS